MQVCFFSQLVVALLLLSPNAVSAVSDGPFGVAPDIGIGFSDAALLTFSFAGFGFLAYST